MCILTQIPQEEELITLEKSKSIIFPLEESKKMHEIGTILSTDKGRQIYSLLINKELHAREIAKILEPIKNPHIPGVKYHLEKMVECGLVSYHIKLKTKKGRYLKYYRAIPVIIITPYKDFFKNSSWIAYFNES